MCLWTASKFIYVNMSLYYKIKCRRPVIFFFTFLFWLKCFHIVMSYSSLLVFFTPSVIYRLKFLFHTEALPQSLIHFCQNHVIYDIQSFVHLRTMWMLQCLVQKERNPVRFSFLLFILFCFCFVFNNKYCNLYMKSSVFIWLWNNSWAGLGYG